MGAIGSLFIEIGANSRALDSGLADVRRKAEATKKHVDSLFSRGLHLPEKILGSVPMVGGALAGLAGAGGFMEIRQQMEAIVETDRMSKRLGVSVGMLAGMELLGGAASEGMARSMFHLAHELGQAAGGSKEARDKFIGLGLDAGELAKLPLDQSLGKIADTISALPPGVMQASAAFELFGRRGEEILPFLLKGSAGLAELTERATSMGLAFSAQDAANVTRAVVAMKTIEGTVTGIFRQAAIGVAPYVEGVAGYFNTLVKDAGGIGPFMKHVFEMIGEAIATLVDELGDLGDAFKDLKGNEKSDQMKVLEAMGPSDRLAAFAANPKLLKGDAPKFAGRTGGRGDAVRAWQEKLQKGAGASAITPLTDEQRATFALRGKIAELNDELTKNIATMGLSADGVKLWELTQLGADEATLRHTRALVEQRDHMEAIGKAFAATHTIAEGARQQAGMQVGALLDESGSATVADLQAKRDAAKKAYEDQVKVAARPEHAAGEHDYEAGKADRRKADLDELEKKLKAIQGVYADVAAARDRALFNKGMEIKASAMGGLEKFKAQWEDVGDAAKTAGLSGQEAAYGYLDLIDKQDKGGEHTKLAGADEAGSSAAQSVISAFATQPSNDPVAKLQAIFALLAAQGAQRAAEAKAIEAAIRAGRIKLNPKDV